MLNREHLKNIQNQYESTGENGYPLAADCGTMSYREALSLQEEIQGVIAGGTCPGVILFVEHDPVITLGIRKTHNQLVSTKQLLENEGIDLVPIKRGGGSTAHNPGQLVIYPIFHLSRIGFRVAPFVRYLEEVGMRILSYLGVETRRVKRYPGLWAGERKIASVGVQLNHGITMHGIAINLWNDLTIFNHIVACGIEGVTMTNALQEGGRQVPMDELKMWAESACFDLLPEKVHRASGRMVQ